MESIKQQRDRIAAVPLPSSQLRMLAHRLHHHVDELFPLTLKEMNGQIVDLDVVDYLIEVRLVRNPHGVVLRFA